VNFLIAFVYLGGLLLVIGGHSGEQHWLCVTGFCLMMTGIPLTAVKVIREMPRCRCFVCRTRRGDP
jgi:hypothetical protein